MCVYPFKTKLFRGAQFDQAVAKQQGRRLSVGRTISVKSMKYLNNNNNNQLLLALFDLVGYNK